MSKTVTLRLDEDVYRRFKSLAKDDNRPLSNFIETAALRFVEEHLHADEFEMDDIRGDKQLNDSLHRGIADAKAGRRYARMLCLGSRSGGDLGWVNAVDELYVLGDDSEVAG